MFEFIENSPDDFSLIIDDLSMRLGDLLNSYCVPPHDLQGACDTKLAKSGKSSLSFNTFKSYQVRFDIFYLLFGLCVPIQEFLILLDGLTLLH